MNENEERKNELNTAIENWQNEIDTVWSKRDTDAARDEIRNLRNLIDNAKKEIAQLDGNEQEELDETDPEELLEDLKNDKDNKEVSKNRLRLSIERLKEEREDYKDNKDLYEEYTNKISEIEEELKELEEKEDDREEKDRKIKILTKGKMKEEKDKKEIEKQIKKKQQEISEIEYDTENAMEEVELSSGEKVEQPKVLKLYKELDALKKQLSEKDKKIEEYQKAIDELKGIDKETKKEDHELTPEEIRYFHGQGDLREYGGENGEDTRKNRLDNDQYFTEKKPEVEEKPKTVSNNATQIDNEISDPEDEYEEITNDNEISDPEDEYGEITNDNEIFDPEDEYEELDMDDQKEIRDGKYKDIFSFSTDMVKKIKIDASKGKAYVTTTRGEKNEIDIEEAMSSKRQLFKDADINNVLKYAGANSFIERMSIKRKINPVILSAINSDPDMVDKYINSLIYEGEEMPFEYEADLSNADLSEKTYRSLNRIGLKEKENGKNVRGVSEQRGIRGFLDRITNKKQRLPMPEIEEEEEGPSSKEKKQAFIDKINTNIDNNIFQVDKIEVTAKEQKEEEQENDDELEI